MANPRNSYCSTSTQASTEDDLRAALALGIPMGCSRMRKKGTDASVVEAMARGRGVGTGGAEYFHARPRSTSMHDSLVTYEI
eukprot:2960187-Rhodomonas_salina.2